MAAKGRQDHYAVLGVSPDAPEEVIRAAYRALAVKYHPDRNPGDRNAELQLKKINAAFAVIGDAQKRCQYDELTQGPVAVDADPAEQKGQGAPRSTIPQEPLRKAPTADHTRRATDRGPNQVEPVATRVAVSSGRVIGWIAGLGMSAAVIAALDGGTCNKEKALVTTAPATSNYEPEPTSSNTATETATATDQWVWRKQQDYVIAFPDTPRPTERGTEATPVGTVNTTVIKLGRPSGVFYQVQQLDYPTGSVVSEQGAMDGGLSELGAAAHEKPRVISDTRVTLGTCSGRSFAVHVTGSTIRALLCVKGTHSYMAMAAIPTGSGSAEIAEVDRFFGSFSITR
jgi:curved DNA-binding protein CbpA